MKSHFDFLFNIPSSFLRSKKVQSSPLELDRPKLQEFLANDDTGYQKKRYKGLVTSLNDGEGVVGGDIYFSVDFKSKTIKIGDKVEGDAVRSNDTSAWRATNIQVVKEDWEEISSETELFQNALDIEEIHESFIGKVSSMYENLIYINNNISFYTNENNCQFHIMVGDWVQCEKSDSPENKSTHILSVSRVVPLRKKTIYGYVSYIQPSYFLINGEVFCPKSTIRLRVRQRDRVAAEVLESQQGQCNWRAMRVWLDQSTKLPIIRNQMTLAALTENLSSSNVRKTDSSSKNLKTYEDNCSHLRELYVQKDGYVMVKGPGYQQYLKILVRNDSKYIVHFLRSVFVVDDVTNNPQLEVDRSISFPVRILPMKSFHVVFSCLGKMTGHSEEKIRLEFSPNQWIYCKVHIQVNEEVVTRLKPLLSHVTQFYKGRIIKGEKPIHSSPFIPIKLPLAQVPGQLWEAVVDKLDLRSLYPLLDEPLSMSNYAEKFSHLLHLEEIEMALQMQKYDIPLTPFSHHGEYLSLVVEGLVENRPSLLVGDSVVAYPPYHDQGGDQIKYEGVIHQVLNNKVLLKFHPNFHNAYNGEDYAVQLQFNRTPLRRCHLAVSLVLDQLGSSLLFPSKLNFQLPQVTFVESTGLFAESYIQYCDGGKSNIDTSNNTKDNSNKDTSLLSDNKTNIVNRGVDTKRNGNNDPNTDNRDISNNKMNNGKRCSSDSIEISNYKALREKHSLNDWFKENKKTEEKCYMKTLVYTLNTSADIQGYCVPVISPNRQMKEASCRPDVTTLKWFNKTLNTEQKMAVKMILEGSSRPLPYIIFGPPGTGKTVTLVEALLQIHKMVPHSRILAVTPSNSACDLVAQRTVDGGRLKQGELVRINAYNRSVESIPEDLAPYCMAADDLQTAVRHRIVVSTATNSGKLYTARLTNGHFTHLFIDEAGQLTEPETCIALGLVNSSSGQIVLVGDPKQLGPVVISPWAKKYGLYQSFLHRLCTSVLYQPEDLHLRTLYEGTNHLAANEFGLMDDNKDLEKVPTTKLTHDPQVDNSIDNQSLNQLIKYSGKTDNLSISPMILKNPNGNCNKEPSVLSKNINENLYFSCQEVDQFSNKLPDENLKQNPSKAFNEKSTYNYNEVNDSSVKSCSQENDSSNKIANRFYSESSDENSNSSFKEGPSIAQMSSESSSLKQVPQYECESSRLIPTSSLEVSRILCKESSDNPDSGYNEIGHLLSKSCDENSDSGLKNVPQMTSEAFIENSSSNYKVTPQFSPKFLGTSTSTGVDFITTSTELDSTSTVIKNNAITGLDNTTTELDSTDSTGLKNTATTVMHTSATTMVNISATTVMNTSATTGMNTAATTTTVMSGSTHQGCSFEPRLVTLLVRNYRSHPSLLSVPSLLFYHSQLISASKSQLIYRLLGWEELPNPDVPLIFHPIRGENQQEGDSPSWFNPAEAFQVARYVISLLNFGLTPSDIGVIAPYKKQVEKILSLLGAFGVDSGIKVGTVEDFQGQERLAIVVSTVRSTHELVQSDIRHSLGFLRCAQRFNVAVTRAIGLLIVTGNPALLSQDDNWRVFIDFCASQKAIKF